MALHFITMHQFSEHTKTLRDCIAFARELEFLLYVLNCEAHDRAMREVKKREKLDELIWRCGHVGCRKTKSTQIETRFEKSKLTFKQRANFEIMLGYSS